MLSKFQLTSPGAIHSSKIEHDADTLFHQASTSISRWSYARARNLKTGLTLGNVRSTAICEDSEHSGTAKVLNSVRPEENKTL